MREIKCLLVIQLIYFYYNPRYPLQITKILLATMMSNPGFSLLYASERLKDNDEMVLAAISIDKWALKYTSERLKDKDEIVLASVEKNGSTLEYASERLRDNQEIVLTAVS